MERFLLSHTTRWHLRRLRSKTFSKLLGIIGERVEIQTDELNLWVL
jgi:hypothetical protein